MTDIDRILKMMSEDGLPEPFLESVKDMSQEIQGITTLLELWEGDCQEDRDEVVADLCELLLDWQRDPNEVVATPRLKGQDLDLLVVHIVVFKSNLVEKINQRGLTIKDLEDRTNLPVAFYKRFFTSVAQPQRSVLQKIARATDLSLDLTISY